MNRRSVFSSSSTTHSYQNRHPGGYIHSLNTQDYANQVSQLSSAHSPSTGYSPTIYDSSNTYGSSPEQFYGFLIDEYGKPTEVFSRLADSLFFHLDRNCHIVELRNTGVVEPIKFASMSVRMGQSEQHASMVLANIQSFYETAGVPYKLARTSKGEQIPVLDRRAWLHTAVFEAKAAPEEAYKHWSRAITLFQLHDPATNAPFPTPLPRSALPYIPDYALSAAYSNWQTQVIVNATRARVHARTASMMGAYGSRSLLGGRMGSTAGSGTGFGMGMPGGSGGGGGGQGDDHATWRDTATAVANLANTVIGISTGGGTGAMFGGGISGFGS